MTKEEIKLLNLNPREIRLLKVLGAAPLSIADLTRASLLPRTTINYILPQLVLRGLVVETKFGKRKKYGPGKLNIPTPPDPLPSSPSSARVFRGQAGLLEVLNEISSLPRGKRLYGVQPDPSFQFSVKKLLQWSALSSLKTTNKAIKKHEIVVEGIVHERSARTIPKILATAGEDPAPFIKNFVGRLADTSRLPEDFLNFPAELFIYDDTVILINWQAELAVSIKDKAIAQFMLDMFRALKFLCRRYDQNSRLLDELGSKFSKTS